MFYFFKMSFSIILREFFIDRSEQIVEFIYYIVYLLSVSLEQNEPSLNMCYIFMLDVQNFCHVL